MKFHRIHALVIRHLYLYKRSLPRIMDIFYWPIMDLLLWGFLSVFLSETKQAGFNVVGILLGAIIFWNIMTQSQKAVAVSFLEDVWERNFMNLFVTPLKASEFVMATIVLGIIRIVIILIVMGLLAFAFYSFNIITFGFYLIPFIGNLLLFGLVLGLFTTGIILRYGSSAQILAFGFLVLLQPFSAVFYPVSALPFLLQKLAYIMPSTYIFEGMREVINYGMLDSKYILYAFLLNIFYLVLVGFYFNRMFKRVKVKGLMMKLEG